MPEIFQGEKGPDAGGCFLYSRHFNPTVDVLARQLAALAEEGDESAYDFPRPMLNKPGFDFSFSGIKSAVHRLVQNDPEGMAEQVADVAAGFQEAVIDVLTYKLMQAARSRNCGHVVVVGGVAANRRLRERVSQAGAEQGIAVHIPGLALCGDNAAMIAEAGHHYLQKGRRGKLDDDVYSRVPL